MSNKLKAMALTALTLGLISVVVTVGVRYWLLVIVVL